MKREYPIAKSDLGDRELALLKETLLSGWILQGPRVEHFEKAFAAYTGAQHAVAVSSGTAALHCALKGVGVGPGDVALTVSHSFIATANSVRLCGAEPIFIDIETHSLNLSVASLAQTLAAKFQKRNGKYYYGDVRELKARTGSMLATTADGYLGRLAAILVVHQVGVPCDIRGVLALAQRWDVPVVEDAACALGSTVEAQRVGLPHSRAACFSFHPRKLLTTGDGGMVTTNDDALADFIRKFRNHGEGEITGTNYRLTDLQAAVGIAQLEKLEGAITMRRQLLKRFLSELPATPDLSWVVPDDGSSWNVQSLPLRLGPSITHRRDELVRFLAERGISARSGIPNAHEQGAYRTDDKLPESQAMNRSTLFVPIYSLMTVDDVDFICQTIRSFA